MLGMRSHHVFIILTAFNVINGPDWKEKGALHLLA